MFSRSRLKVAGLGAMGLVVAAVLAALSLQLVSQPVGLSSEPVTAGNRLAPAPAKADGGGTGAGATPRTSWTAPTKSVTGESGETGKSASTGGTGAAGDGDQLGAGVTPRVDGDHANGVVEPIHHGDD